MSDDRSISSNSDEDIENFLSNQQLLETFKNGNGMYIIWFSLFVYLNVLPLGL